MKSGGIMYHEIGLGGHSAKDPFQHYYFTAKSGKDPFSLNGLRISDYIKALTDGGFQCTVVDKRMRYDYELERALLLERYRDYSDEDLLCENAILVCQKS